MLLYVVQTTIHEIAQWIEQWMNNAQFLTDKSKYRFVCWNLSDRGAVGETILHLCMLNSTAIHADLAKRLLRFYPMLISDIYLCDEYYGKFARSY